MESLDFLSALTETGLNTVDYQYFHQLFDNRTVIFNQEIQENIVECVYLPLRDFEKDDISAPVTLILNSPGGSVSDGFFLAHYLKGYSKPLNIIVTGYAASMSAVILCAGFNNNNIKRICYPSSYALIHDGYVALTASESKTAADIMAFNDEVDKQIRQFILDNSKITPELYDSKTRHQWFLSSSEMKELGLVDEIIGSEKL